MFSYYGIAGSFTIGIINYILLGFQFPVDNFYMHSFEIWLATTVVFIGSGNVGFTLLEYRIGEKDLVCFPCLNVCEFMLILPPAFLAMAANQMGSILVSCMKARMNILD